MGNIGDREHGVMDEAVFCGRENEIANLLSAFEDVAAGSGPQLVLLLGDSGVGKTRLIRRFYEQLATQIDHRDPAGYWPDALGDGLNPSFAGRLETGALPPFMWLGVACREHNDGLEGMDAIVGPHVEPILRARAKRELGQDAIRAVAKGTIGSLPVVGPFIANALDTSEWVQRARKAFGAEAGEKSGDFLAPAVRQIDENVDSIIDCLADLLDAPVGLADIEGNARAIDRKAAGRDRIPAVVFLDDAQRLGINPAKQALVYRMLDRARERRWPLLFIAAHWHSDWLRDSASDDANAFAVRAASWARAINPKWQPVTIAVQRGAIYRPMLATLLPGLTSHQQDMLLARAGGNPRLISEIVAFARDNPRLFENLDTNGALTESGAAEIETMEVEVERLVRRRINLAPAAVRAAASLAALQGEEFLGSITIDTAHLLGIEAGPEDISAIERPHAIAVAGAKDLYSFVQTLYRDAALANLPNVLQDADAAKAGLRKILRAKLNDQASLDAMDRGQRNLALNLGLSLFGRTEAMATEKAAWLLALAGDAAAHHDYATAVSRFDQARGLTRLSDLDLAARAPTSSLMTPALIRFGRVGDARRYTDWRFAAWRAGKLGSGSGSGKTELKDIVAWHEFAASYADIDQRDGLGIPGEVEEAKTASQAEMATWMQKEIEDNPDLGEHLRRYLAPDLAIADAQAAQDPEALAIATQAALDAVSKLAETNLEHGAFFAYVSGREKRKARLSAAFAALVAQQTADRSSAGTSRAGDRAFEAARTDIEAAISYSSAAQIAAFPFPPWEVRRQVIEDVLFAAGYLIQFGFSASAYDLLHAARPIENAMLADPRSAADVSFAGYLAHCRAVSAAATGRTQLAYEEGKRAVAFYDETLALEDNLQLRIRLASLLAALAQWGHGLSAVDSAEWTDDAIAAICDLPDGAVQGPLLGEFTEFLLAACRAWYVGGGRVQGEEMAAEIERRVSATPDLYEPAYRDQIREKLAAFKRI